MARLSSVFARLLITAPQASRQAGGLPRTATLQQPLSVYTSERAGPRSPHNGTERRDRKARKKEGRTCQEVAAALHAQHRLVLGQAAKVDHPVSHHYGDGPRNREEVWVSAPRCATRLSFAEARAAALPQATHPRLRGLAAAPAVAPPATAASTAAAPLRPPPAATRARWWPQTGRPQTGAPGEAAPTAWRSTARAAWGRRP